MHFDAVAATCRHTFAAAIAARIINGDPPAEWQVLIGDIADRAGGADLNRFAHYLLSWALPGIENWFHHSMPASRSAFTRHS